MKNHPTFPFRRLKCLNQPSLVFFFLLLACTSPQKQEEKSTTAPLEEEQLQETPNNNYLSSVFESLDHIPSDHEQVTSRLLLPNDQWSLLPQVIQDTIPSDGRVFLLANAKSLALDRVVLVEVEITNTAASLYPQYLLFLNNDFEVIQHKSLFSSLEGEYSITRHNIWKYGEGDLLSIAMENGPWGYNVVSWELLQLTENGIQVLETKDQAFDDYDISLAYFELIRDSPVDQEEGPTIKLSELGIAAVSEATDILDQYDDTISRENAVEVLDNLGFEVVEPSTGFYRSDQEKMLIPLMSVGNSYAPHPEVMYCDGSYTYFFTREDFDSPDLLLAREYADEVHFWKVKKDLKKKNNRISFSVDGFLAEGQEIEQKPTLKVRIYRDKKTDGWILKVDDDYFATKETLLEKFELTDGDVACG